MHCMEESIVHKDQGEHKVSSSELHHHLLNMTDYIIACKLTNLGTFDVIMTFFL